LIEALHEIVDSIKAAQSTGCPPGAAREFALAITAIEDAQFRVVRAELLKSGRFALPEDAALTLRPTVPPQGHIRAQDDVHQDRPHEGQLNIIDAIDALDVDNEGLPPAA